ncbi:hypothetical protein MOE90_20850 [Bacillus spizizenii]|nr:hypothetical protein [Bacillus spizizenii]MCY9125040.1 hypothetical protein [Bacillus spizizenii]
MTNTKMTLKEAVQKWVGEFNAVPQSLISRAIKNDIDNFSELTKPTAGEMVWSNELQGEFEIVSIENEVAILNVDGEEKEVNVNDLHLEHEDFLPIWGTMWRFGSSLDENWTRENLEIVSQCGFRIYEDHEENDIYIGIDGAGYDFYESHWTPLYKARGLQWHSNN